MDTKAPETKDVTEVVKCRAGAVGCPMAIIDVKAIAGRLAELLSCPGYKHDLERKPAKPFNFHSRFCAAVTGCPNACAQPQIRDFGVIGRARIAFDESLCSGCGFCETACKENAIVMVEGLPRIDGTRCIGCSDCVRACQSDALTVGGTKYEVIIGGKLGRHARLAESLGDFETSDEVVECLRRAVTLLIEEGQKGERLGALMERWADKSAKAKERS